MAPDAMRTHYLRIFEGYAEALAESSNRGEITVANPEVAAWALMGVGEVVGMRYLSWGERRDHVSVGEGPCRQARATGAQAGTRT